MLSFFTPANKSGNGKRRAQNPVLKSPAYFTLDDLRTKFAINVTIDFSVRWAGYIGFGCNADPYLGVLRIAAQDFFFFFHR